MFRSSFVHRLRHQRQSKSNWDDALFGSWRSFGANIREAGEEGSSDSDSEEERSEQPESEWQQDTGDLKKHFALSSLQHLGKGKVKIEDIVVIILFVCLQSTRVLLLESLNFKTFHRDDTLLAGCVGAAISFAISLGLTFRYEEANPVTDWLLNWHVHWRTSLIAFLFTSATTLYIFAFKSGLSLGVIMLLGYAYIPVATGASSVFFQRHYGKISVLSLSMMCIGAGAFMLIRERCHAADCQIMQDQNSNLLGFLMLLGSVITSAIASIGSERMHKGISAGLIRQTDGESILPVYVLKAHLDISMVQYYGWFFVAWRVYKGDYSAPFAGWGWKEPVLVLVFVGQCWFAALVTRRFNTVVKALIQSITGVLTAFFADPVLHKFLWELRLWQSVLLVAIVFLAGFMFQTDRLHVSTLKSSFGIQAARYGKGKGRSIVEMSKRDILRMHGHRPHSPFDDALDEITFAEKQRSDDGASTTCWSTYVAPVLKYSTIILYILADGGRGVLQSVALSGSPLTPQVFSVGVAASGLFLAMALTLSTEGWEGVVRAGNWKKMMRNMLSGFLFALTSSLQSLAYALGIPPAMNMVLGRLYTPLMAILGRVFLKRTYLELEWTAIAILTLATICYGCLQQEPSEEGKSASVNTKQMLAADLCVLGSAISAVLNSLRMEVVMREEDEAFVVQKIRLDFGALVWAVAFLPIMGWIPALTGGGASGDKFAFWKARPLTGACASVGYCTGGAFVDWESGASPSQAADACECGGGFFVGWGQLSVYAALAMNVFFSWITGKVVKQFSSMYRAVADGFSIAVVYFVLEPLVFGHQWQDNWALSLLAALIPISALAFTFAAREFQLLVQLAVLRQEFGASKEQQLLAGSAAKSEETEEETSTEQESDAEDDEEEEEDARGEDRGSE